MLRIVLLAAFLSVPAVQGQQIKVHAHGDWPFSAGGKEFVLRSPADLVAAINGNKGNDAEEKAVAELAKALKVKDIDWKSQMLVVVRLERVHPTYRGSFQRLDLSGKTAVVHYSYWLPVAARPQDRDPTPVAYAFMTLVDRFDGEVRFKADQRLPK